MECASLWKVDATEAAPDVELDLNRRKPQFLLWNQVGAQELSSARSASTKTISRFASRDAAVRKGNDASADRHRLFRTKSGTRPSVVAVRRCIRIRSFSVKALAQSRPAQSGLGEFPATVVKIALSKPIISTTMDEAELSASQRSREEPHYQQDASANQPVLAGRLVSGRSGSSTKQTAHDSTREVRCRLQWVWNTNAHSFRIHTV